MSRNERFHGVARRGQYGRSLRGLNGVFPTGTAVTDRNGEAIGDNTYGTVEQSNTIQTASVPSGGGIYDSWGGKAVLPDGSVISNLDPRIKYNPGIEANRSALTKMLAIVDSDGQARSFNTTIGYNAQSLRDGTASGAVGTATGGVQNFDNSPAGIAARAAAAAALERNRTTAPPAPSTTPFVPKNPETVSYTPLPPQFGLPPGGDGTVAMPAAASETEAVVPWLEDTANTVDPSSLRPGGRANLTVADGGAAASGGRARLLAPGSSGTGMSTTTKAILGTVAGAAAIGLAVKLFSSPKRSRR